MKRVGESKERMNGFLVVERRGFDMLQRWFGARVDCEWDLIILW
jgi:hypothetical protein